MKNAALVKTHAWFIFVLIFALWSRFEIKPFIFHKFEMYLYYFNNYLISLRDIYLFWNYKLFWFLRDWIFTDKFASRGKTILRSSYSYGRNYKTDFTAFLLPVIRSLHTCARDAHLRVKHVRGYVALQNPPRSLAYTRHGEMSKSSFTVR